MSAFLVLIQCNRSAPRVQNELKTGECSGTLVALGKRWAYPE
jgi:hypothetical protein